jgi:L-threonylcarbamoyladenylate synthase
MNARQLRDALGVLDGLFAGLAVYSRSNLVAAAAAKSGILARTMADDPQAVAHELFAVLRDFDAQGARLIWVEEPPADAKWEAVRDRLSRAAAAA